MLIPVALWWSTAIAPHRFRLIGQVTGRPPIPKSFLSGQSARVMPEHVLMCGPAELCGKFVKGLHYGSKITRTGVLDYVKPDGGSKCYISFQHPRTDRQVCRALILPESGEHSHSAHREMLIVCLPPEQNARSPNKSPRTRNLAF